MDSGHAREKPRFAVGCLPLSGDGQPDTFTQTKRVRILDSNQILRQEAQVSHNATHHPRPIRQSGEISVEGRRARQNYSGVSNHPPPNPARRKPLTTYGQRRISLQMKPER